MKPIPLMWMACACYVWPVLPGGGRCGRCGQAVEHVVSAPPSGKAEPLDARRRRSLSLAKEVEVS